MAFQLQEIGGLFSPMVLVPVWVSDALRFIVVPMFPLPMPPPPDVGPMRVIVCLGFTKLLITVLMKYFNEMVPYF